ncbi:type II toxin-antitoxin system Phd/YefM family antitoxin [Actinophytocola sediminis]
MEQVSIRELRQHTAGILARVQAGESLVITKRGKPIARIVPAVVSADLSDLVAEGWVTPPRPFLMPTVSAPAGSDAGELISRLRDEERC